MMTLRGVPRVRGMLGVRPGLTQLHTFRTGGAVLFGDEASPPVRFVLMTAGLLDVRLRMRRVDLFTGEHLTDTYRRINPLGKVPALVLDGGEVICDSHAIALHLCRARCPHSSAARTLLPPAGLSRARLDQMLFFSAGTLFPLDSAILSSVFRNAWPPDDDALCQQWDGALDHLQRQLAAHRYLAADQVTLCDLCCGAIVSSCALVLPLSARHVRVATWLADLEAMACFLNYNAPGIQRLQYYLQKITSTSK